jgi:hypothetical protein
MNNKTFFAIAIIFILILVGTMFFNQNKTDYEQVNEEELTREVEIISDITLDTKYQYKDGKHFFAGSVETPTPCYSVETNVIKEAGMTEIQIITTPPDADIMCSQVVTEQMFNISFEGAQDEIIIATLNGEIVNLNLFEVPQDQTIQDFIIYNKI